MPESYGVMGGYSVRTVSWLSMTRVAGVTCAGGGGGAARRRDVRPARSRGGRASQSLKTGKEFGLLGGELLLGDQPFVVQTAQFPDLDEDRLPGVVPGLGQGRRFLDLPGFLQVGVDGGRQQQRLLTALGPVGQESEEVVAEFGGLGDRHPTQDDAQIPF